MDFVTIHNLSRDLNRSARVIRYRLADLIANGKIKEPQDCYREDFKDLQHFVWKIHRLRFMQETGWNSSVTSSLTTDNKSDNQSSPTVNQPGNDHSTSSVDPKKLVTQLGNDVGNDPLAREMIDLLKEQIRIKDGQLKEQGEQLKDNHRLNIQLNGALLNQSQKIEDLLRLTEGKLEASEIVAKESKAVDDDELRQAA